MDFVVQLLYELDILKNVSSEIIRNDYDNFIKQTMENQPLLNIGIIGHVANGKSTIVEKISNEKTQRHSDERVNNITIKLGYANAKICKCNTCNAPKCYASFKSSETNFILARISRGNSEFTVLATSSRILGSGTTNVSP